MNAASLASWVWASPSIGAAGVRALLTPASAVFAAAVRQRNARFDRGLGVQQPVVPVLSVGNLTVGGTGKTPVASWCVQRLAARGAAPAIVLRGYGDDEWRVHELLTPGIPVIVNADRAHGVREAVARGAELVVLDDAFQHRRIARSADLVLISADAWRGAPRLLPAGPFREPLHALNRATAVVITAKMASDAQVDAVAAAVALAAPNVPCALMRISLDSLRPAPVGSGSAERADGAVQAGQSDPSPEAVTQNAPTAQPLDVLRDQSILAISAIGDPDAFEAQLRAAGARVESRRFADHHAFSAAEVRELADQGRDGRRLVCTLKDAVKLGPMWPRARAAPWYVSQTLVVERGEDAIEHALQRVLSARPPSAPPTLPSAG